MKAEKELHKHCRTKWKYKYQPRMNHAQSDIHNTRHPEDTNARVGKYSKKFHLQNPMCIAHLHYYFRLGKSEHCQGYLMSSMQIASHMKAELVQHGRCHTMLKNMFLRKWNHKPSDKHNTLRLADTNAMDSQLLKMSRLQNSRYKLSRPDWLAA